MIADLFGTTARGNPDTKAAAEFLGVSQRTVQRWGREGLPDGARSAGAGALRSRHQTWRSSPAGRRAGLGQRREARLRSKGTTISFTGKIKISNDQRNRSTTVQLTGDQMGQILDAGLAGDDRAAHAALERGFGRAMGGSVRLEIGAIDTYK